MSPLPDPAELVVIVVWSAAALVLAALACGLYGGVREFIAIRRRICRRR